MASKSHPLITTHGLYAHHSTEVSGEVAVSKWAVLSDKMLYTNLVWAVALTNVAFKPQGRTVQHYPFTPPGRTNYQYIPFSFGLATWRLGDPYTYECGRFPDDVLERVHTNQCRLLQHYTFPDQHTYAAISWKLMLRKTVSHVPKQA